jgi:ankyrin repeat protein
MSKELFKAIKKQDFNEIKNLLESGVNVNYCLDFGETPLLFAIFCNHKNIELITLLIKHGANVDQLRQDKLYPFYLACEYGNLELIKILIDFCSDINKTCSDRTPLFIAAKNGYLDIVKFLIKNGADVNIKNNNDVSPLWISVQFMDECYSFDNDLFLKQKKLAKILLNNGANLI